MILANLDITDAFNTFYVEYYAIERNRDSLEPLSTERLLEIFKDMSEEILARGINEDFGTLIEYLASNIVLIEEDHDEFGEVTQYGDNYDMVYQLSNSINMLWSIIKFGGTGGYRSSGYDAEPNITLGIETNNNKHYLKFQTTRLLYHRPYFGDGTALKEEADKIVDVMTYYELFRIKIDAFIFEHYPVTTLDIKEVDFQNFFVGICELIYIYRGVDKSMPDDLDNLFKDIVEITDGPESQELLSNFYLSHDEYITDLFKFLTDYTHGKFMQLNSWGVLNERLLIGLVDERR